MITELRLLVQSLDSENRQSKELLLEREREREDITRAVPWRRERYFPAPTCKRKYLDDGDGLGKRT